MPLLMCQTDIQYNYSACDSALAYASFDGERVDVDVYVYVHIYICIRTHNYFSHIHMLHEKVFLK